MATESPPGRWGPPGHEAHVGLDPRTKAFARTHLGEPNRAPTPQARALQSARFTTAELARLFPGVDVGVEDPVRARYARGMSYPDMLEWRTTGDPMSAPDAVVFPRHHDQVVEVLRACSSEGIVVVPVGGATSVTGAITPSVTERSIVVSTRSLDRVLELDTESGIAQVESGITGPELERQLAENGLTLGHFPQSWERASIGGYIAARSSGQASGGYGRIEDMLLGARVATPVGTWDVGGFPASSSGPDLRHLVLGSEGTLGVITSAQLRLRRRPGIRQYAAAIVPGEFARAIAAVRDLTRSPLRPTVLRASDEPETAALLTMSRRPGLLGAAVDAYLRVRRAVPGSLIILGWEADSPEVVVASREFARDVLRESTWLGAAPGRSWERGRFHGPYLRDDLMDEGYLVETFETVTSWSAVASLHESVRAVAQRVVGPRSYVMAHISHTYDTGASVYFTVLAAGWSTPGEASRRWREAKAQITDAIVAAGGAVSHHHGVGRDHRDWLPQQIGPIGMDVLHAVKRAVDPHGVMNPGAVA